jgi:hypothetical protein
MSFVLNIDSERDFYRLELNLPILGRVFRLKIDAPPAWHFKKEMVATQPELGSTEPPRVTHVKLDQPLTEDGLKKFRMEVKRSFEESPEIAAAVARDLLDRHGFQTKVDLKEQYKREVFTGRIARTVGGVSGEGFRTDSEAKKVEDLPQMPSCDDLRKARDQMDVAGFDLQARLEKAESAEEMGRILIEERGPDIMVPMVEVLADELQKKRDIVAAVHSNSPVDHVHELGSCSICDLQAREDVRFQADLQAAVASQAIMESSGYSSFTEMSPDNFASASQKDAVDSAFSEGAEPTTQADEGGDSPKAD